MAENVVDEIRDDELADNPTKRVPVCLCLDVSRSMEGEPIEQLNEGVKLFYEAINDDLQAKQAADVCVVTFASHANKVQDFQSIIGEMSPQFSTEGDSTHMGEGVNLALDLLETRKKEYQESGVEYFQPWLVLITDGEPHDNYQSAARRTSDLANNRKLTIFPIGVEDANLNILKEFSPKRRPIKLKGLNFKEFFQWLSQSVSITSNSKEGETIQLSSTDDWASVEP
ncbi:VWA domain-containing protein [Helicobacter saguini]|uniref:VWA domain-containing protein n=1 Tax=Helicobacter saguini TaxID=1548018 RepID=A0A347VT21_9HELI|nr:VWA domain-containing protein [Helicobacter saguini]MWV62269.1 VWA domain-containing protein [Helicobacter saguini]MWV67058.1 VWA domain-containing protein [Helicobacter saguini]MWV69408.1 VWA domain-containing protein [Helicobacter saguini]MWV71038.1 VWA domain-containing protein [Helicobacter saguini]TLD95056.1 VWA domain-containing protein [Helicobacter saguini]